MVRLAAAVSEAGQIGGDDADVRRQGCGAPGEAPGREVRQSRGVGRAGRQRLLRLGVGHGGVDLGRGQDTGQQRRAERDQVVQCGLQWVGERKLSDAPDAR